MVPLFHSVSLWQTKYGIISGVFNITDRAII